MFPCFDWVVGKTQSNTEKLLKETFYAVKGMQSRPYIIFSKHPQFINFKNQHILIVGGGPSTNTIDWNPEKYDSIWSMNHFWKNNKLKNLKLDLISLGAEVPLADPGLNSYLTANLPLVGLELHPQWLDPVQKSFLNNHFYNINRLFFYATYAYGKVGVGIRMVILASELQAKRISFVGFDGPEAILEGKHAFEHGKTSMPSGLDWENAHDVFQIQYDTFWKYIQEIFPAITYFSLDKTNCLHYGIRNGAA